MFQSRRAIWLLVVVLWVGCDTPQTQTSMHALDAERFSLVGAPGAGFGSAIALSGGQMIVASPLIQQAQVYTPMQPLQYLPGPMLGLPIGSTAAGTVVTMSGDFAITNFTDAATSNAILYGRNQSGIDAWGGIGTFDLGGGSANIDGVAIGPDISVLVDADLDQLYVHQRDAATMWTFAGVLNEAIAGFGSEVTFAGTDLLVATNGGPIRIYRYSSLNIPPVVYAGDLVQPGISSVLFGNAMAGTEDYLVVGDSQSERVHVYLRVSEGVFTLLQTIVTPSVEIDSKFGTSVAVSQERIVIGAPGDDAQRGVVYVYNLNQEGTLFEHWETISRPVEEMPAAYGEVVSIDDQDGHLIAVGEPSAGVGDGRVEVFVMNTPPILGSDFVPTTSVPVVIDVLANDWDPDDTAYTLALGDPPRFGTFAILGDTIRFTPNVAGEPDSFTYTLTDPLGAVGETFVSVGIQVDAIDDEYDVSATTPSRLEVTLNDVATTTFEVIVEVEEEVDPAFGVVSTDLNTIVFEPTGQDGTVTFKYSLRIDSVVDIATVTLNVGANEAPTWVTPGAPETISVVIGQPFQIDLEATDPDGDALTYRGVNLPGDTRVDANRFIWTPIIETTEDITFSASDGRHETLSPTLRLVATVTTNPCLTITCADNQTCQNGICFDECIENNDCEGEQLCFDGTCKTDACEAITCPSAEICYAGSCYGSCQDNQECGTANSCYEGRCAAEACEDVICAEGDVCFSGSCFAQCSESSDCNSGSQCFESRCATSSCENVTCASGEACFDGSCFAACIPGESCDGTCKNGACVPDDSNGCCATTRPPKQRSFLFIALIGVILAWRRRRETTR